MMAREKQAEIPGKRWSGEDSALWPLRVLQKRLTHLSNHVLWRLKNHWTPGASNRQCLWLSMCGQKSDLRWIGPVGWNPAST